MTAVSARNASTIQKAVAPSTVACRAQAARAVVASRSPVFLRPSRVPTQAASPAANTQR